MIAIKFLIPEIAFLILSKNPMKSLEFKLQENKNQK